MDSFGEYASDDDSDNVRSQCRRDWRRLKKVQSELENFESVALVAPQDGDLTPENDTSSRLQLLHALEKRLKAELQFVRESDLKTLPENVDLQLLIVGQNQEKKLDSLRETLTYSQAVHSEVLEDIKQEEETRSSLSDLNEALKKKVALIDGASGGESGNTLESVLAEMSTKVSKVTEMNKYFKDTLKEILSKHFPLPHSKETGGIADSGMSIKLSLMSMVGRLIEQSLNSPEQPYIDVDDRFWPPHVEFLLRCQIVLKDPNNSHRIKLVPFHL